MKSRPPAAFPLFASEFQARLLAELFDEPNAWHSASELRDRLEVAPATLHDELHRLLSAGLLERRSDRRPYEYRPDMGSPLAEPIKTLVNRSVGVSARLRRLLDEEPGVMAAAIFGSWARGEAHANSDIDLMVVGHVDFRHLARAVRPLEREIQREINLVAYAPQELHDRRGSGFLRRVRAAPMENLVGDLRSTLQSAA